MNHVYVLIYFVIFAAFVSWRVVVFLDSGIEKASFKLFR